MQCFARNGQHAAVLLHRRHHRRVRIQRQLAVIVIQRDQAGAHALARRARHRHRLLHNVPMPGASGLALPRHRHRFPFAQHAYVRFLEVRAHLDMAQVGHVQQVCSRGYKVIQIHRQRINRAGNRRQDVRVFPAHALRRHRRLVRRYLVPPALHVSRAVPRAQLLVERLQIRIGHLQPLAGRFHLRWRHAAVLCDRLHRLQRVRRLMAVRLGFHHLRLRPNPSSREPLSSTFCSFSSASSSAACAFLKRGSAY